jgi:DEAD/DEAH box helicase domain-containing protein
MGMKPEAIVTALKLSPRYGSRVEHVEVLPPREAVYETPEEDLPLEIGDYLTRKKIKLYCHQSAAIDYLRAGKNVLITTPTASGKTLAFNLPVLADLSLDETATALYIYPAKALANDQLKVLKDLEEECGISVTPGIYDGDTPPSRRARVRESSRIIITNPHELHQVLPWHYKWQTFLMNLRYVVLDEAHRYRGVFGSNVALLIRRLRRLCLYYGAQPRFVLSTATLADPLEFGEKLTGLSFELVNSNGSPSGRKQFVFYNPFFDGAGELSTHQETRDLFLYLIRHGLQTLCFTSSRRMAELIARWSREAVHSDDPETAARIAAYRGGYLPEERRNIESGLKKGHLRGVTSTNALELGIDVGHLDGVIISGYPGTVMSTWQQAGRAGRGREESMAILVAFQNPLDQYLMKHPEAFFGKPHEHAIVDLANPYIVSGHLLCAAAEMPLIPGEEQALSDVPLEELLAVLGKENLLQGTPHGWIYTGKGRAHEAVGLDQIGRDVYRVVCEGKLLETMDTAQAYREAHQGAVHLHQGETCVVEAFDREGHVIEVKRKTVDYYTQVLRVVDLRVLEEIRRMSAAGIDSCFGELDVKEEFTGYKIIRNDRIEGREPLDLPPLIFRTMGLWFTISDETRQRIFQAKLHFGGGLHGIEHAMIGILPLQVMCDRWDIGGLSTPGHADTGRPTIFIYDGYEGGIGLAEKAYDLLPEMIRMTYELVRDCPCDAGCPACVYSPKCGNENKPLDKIAARIILEDLLGVSREA